MAGLEDRVASLENRASLLEADVLGLNGRLLAQGGWAFNVTLTTQPGGPAVIAESTPLQVPVAAYVEIPRVRFHQPIADSGVGHGEIFVRPPVGGERCLLTFSTGDIRGSSSGESLVLGQPHPITQLDGGSTPTVFGVRVRADSEAPAVLSVELYLRLVPILPL